VTPNSTPAHVAFIRGALVIAHPVVGWSEVGEPVIGHHTAAEPAHVYAERHDLKVIGIEYGTWLASDADLAARGIAYYKITEEQIDYLLKIRRDITTAKKNDTCLPQLLSAAYKEFVENRKVSK
jgi:hypothetical protein